MRKTLFNSEASPGLEAFMGTPVACFAQQIRSRAHVMNRQETRASGRQTTLKPRYCARVLVVDDVDEALTKFLEVKGYEVRVAHDGAEALDVASEFRPDIVFLDLSMERMDGIETCARLRENPVTQEAAIFALSGVAEAARATSSSAAWFDAQLLKPIEFEVLGALVNTVTRSS
jgi:CheY-like chemotaxis protein